MEIDKYPFFTAKLKQMGLSLPEVGKIIEIPARIKLYNFPGIQKKHWRVDYCWSSDMLIVEIEGGVFKEGGGGHNRGAGYRNDVIRHNTLKEMGYTVFQFLPEHLPKQSTYALDVLERFFKK